MLVIVLLAVVCGFFLYEVLTRDYKKPPGPPCLPIVGNLPLLKKLSKELGGQYLALEHLAKKYKTRVLGLQLGSDFVITVFSYEVVRQVLTKEEYEGRPNSFFLKLRCMGEKRGITCTDGETWINHRNFLVRHLRNIGFGKTPMERMIQEELNEMKHVIETDRSDNIRINRLISPSVLSVLFGLIAGTRIKRTDPQLNRLLDLFYRRSRAFDMSGGVLSQFPFLRYIAPQWSGYNLIKRINTEMKDFFMKLIEEHRQTWEEGREDDVIHAFLTEMKKNPESKIFTDDHLMMVCLDVLIAGAETTGNTVDYAFLLMVFYPDIQKKVQEALDNNIADIENLTYADRQKVPYIQAVLMECERFCHIVPTSGPRRVLKSTYLDGYYIPKNTTVLISLRSVFKDPMIWGDPDVFRPERFLDSDGKLQMNEKLIGFGLGRRRCLGETLARSCIFLFFAGILQKYEVKLKDGSAKPTLKPLPGITLCPQKYEVQFVKRCA